MLSGKIKIMNNEKIPWPYLQAKFQYIQILTLLVKWAPALTVRGGPLDTGGGGGVLGSFFSQKENVFQELF